MENYYSIDRLLKNVNVLQVGISKIQLLLYIVIQKMRKDLKQKNKTLTKREHLFKDYTSNYNVDVLNCFNLELRLKDTESAIKNKLKKIFSELTRFKFGDNTSFSV